MIKGIILSTLIVMILIACKSKKVIEELPTGKNDTFYHGIELTADVIPVRVYRWNTKNYDSIIKKKHINLLIKEVIDDSNRVKQIEFLRKGEPTDFYDFPISKVTYDYGDGKITETLYDIKGNTLFVDEHVSHFRSVYYLDSDNYIENVERQSDLITRDSVITELAGGPTPLEELEQDVKDFYERNYKDKPLEVEFYKYSYYKMNGVYPVSRDFSIDTLTYFYRRTNPRLKDGKVIFDTLYIPTLIEKGIEDGFKKLKSQN